MSQSSDIEDWRAAPRSEISSADHPLLKRLIDARNNGEFVSITYYGGSEPGTERQIQPQGVFVVEAFGKTPYIAAWCELRQETRTFRLDRIRIEGLPEYETRALATGGAAKRGQSTGGGKARRGPSPRYERVPTRVRSPSQPGHESGGGGNGLVWIFVIGLLLLLLAM